MVKQKGLGRGLDALFGSDKIDLRAKPMAQIEEIAVCDIMPNPSQPRKQFDEQSIAELANSISTLGLIQPITVKKDGEKYMLISGERRWRAAQVAGIATLPAYIRQVEDIDLQTMALVENIQREDLNAIEVAISLQRLVDECGITQEQLADKVGKKRSTISNFLRLLALPEQIQLAVKEGIITMGHAKAIAGIEGVKNQLSALKKCIQKSLSVRQTEEYVRKLNNKKPKDAVADEEYPESYTRLIECMEPYFNEDISIKRTAKGGGKIVISFGSDKEIENFITRFVK